MSFPTLAECHFLIPVRRDANLSDGDLHATTAWEWLENELFVKFEGGTIAPGEQTGFYRDADTGQRVDDPSRKFTVAVNDDRLDELRALLQTACSVFQQKCIYLSIAARVEFVTALP